VNISSKIIALISQGLFAILIIVSLMLPGTINAGFKNTPLLKEVIN
jgi:hypothetical protein